MTNRSTINIEKLAEKYYGRMNDCSAGAFLKGPCGDEMEIYIDIENNKIVDIKVFTDGCEYTRTCGVTMASMAHHKTIYEAMGISAKDVLDNCPTIPDDHTHCNILAVSVLYRAIASYLLTRNS
ncbi:MAG: iron-sulfur cluster assembly scaffold protein [Candidatus Margulisbacteria bacterium]|nr:iron-sulfur cluster assembly scaffold protein [Candidatus Margulisiibacteriota bacterium]